MLLDCSMARSVWDLALETVIKHICPKQDRHAKGCLFSLLKNMPNVEFTTMSIALWVVWHARRKGIHEEIFQSPFSTHIFINSFLLELQILEKPKATFIKSGPIRRNHWLVAPKGLCKINVDAALTRNEPTGVVGALCRDH